MDSSVERRLFDRRLYFTIAMLFPAIVLLGFARTYYLKGLFATPPLPSRLVHLHGLVMTAWVVLFVSQVRLVATKRIRLHQKLGYASIALAVLIIATGLPTAVRAAKYGSASTPPGVTPLSFLLIPTFDLVMFALFFGAAIVYRRRPSAHKALMLLTALNFVPPALARIPIASLQAAGPVWFFGFPTLVALICLIVEARRHARVNKVLAIGTALLIASYVARLALMTTPTWMSIAAWLITFV
jgi:hypothetical protein